MCSSVAVLAVPFRVFQALRVNIMAAVMSMPEAKDRQGHRAEERS